MKVVNGTYSEAKIFTDNVEDEALSQIQSICNHPIFENEKVRIMPDVHAGMGCVIGFTSTMTTDKVVANLIGVDVGCGMNVNCVGAVDIDFSKLDSVIRENIPHGFNACNTKHFLFEGLEKDIKEVCKIIGDENKLEYHLLSLGTLGSGNHFIELNVDSNNLKYLVIHSGSRNFGNKVAKYYQDLAERACQDKSLSKDLMYLEGTLADEYLYCMKIAQRFAMQNRYIMADTIMEKMGLNCLESFTTQHNYISDDSIIRKGAVSAKLGEKLIIPMNMRDGSLICVGKGNEDWNTSAPHGAGRLMSRTKAKKNILLNDFVKSMEGVYTSCVSAGTLDESPMAYKPMYEIIENIGDTVEILEVIKPLYNFKSN